MKAPYPVPRSTAPVAIIGGGFTGLSLAIGLQQQNIPYKIYEASSVFSELGAGITFAPNGVRAMAKIHPMLHEEFLRQSTSNGMGSQRDVFLTCRDGRNDDAPLLFPNEGHAYRSIHRATFLSILASLLPPDAVRFDKRLESFTQVDDYVNLVFADGTQTKAAAVIGCDGVRSHVRTLICPQEPQYSHIYSYRGLARMEKAVAVLGRDLAMSAQNYTGDGAHVISYPIDNGTLLNIVGCKHDANGWPHSRWQMPSTQEQLLDDFHCLGAAARRVLSMVESYDQWAGYDLPVPLSPFFRGRVALAGDAAHCTTPHLGAGVSMALEDAHILSQLLGAAKVTSSFEAAFRVFDQGRRPRTERVITASKEAAAIYQYRKPGAKDLNSELQGRFDWIWDIDLDAHLQQALAKLDDSMCHESCGFTSTPPIRHRLGIQRSF